jgi:hypothetical protein
MSYLNPLRLHFAGQFQAAVSTVNNIHDNFDSATFKPEYQEVGAQGSWNPSGDGDFRLSSCSVTGAYDTGGAPVGPSDPVLGYLVADSDRAAPGKLVDLDTDQQMCSQIWGLEVRICDGEGANLLRSRFEVAAFTDLWTRVYKAPPGDANFAAMYQSTLYDLEWGDVSSSPFLTALKAKAAGGLLSIKFNVDGFSDQFHQPNFTYGRVVGTIGPALAGEPHHFVPGRQLMTSFAPRGITPVGDVNFCQAVVDEQRGKVYLDLGNALPTASSGGPPADIGTVSVSSRGQPPVSLGTVSYLGQGWYESTAGIVELPVDRALTSEELAALAKAPLAIARSGVSAPVVAEDPTGAHVRADSFVFRLDPGQSAQVTLYATRFGSPYAGAAIGVTDDPGGLQGGGSSGDVLQFPTQVTADGNGVASLTVGAGDPGNPRGFIDGQVYAVYPTLAETTTSNPWDFVSLLVFDTFEYSGAPTWELLQPIFQQYANLYPVMSRFLDLSEQPSVSSARDMLLLAFKLDVGDPNSMPVTRDLSTPKRAAVVQWLESLGPYEPAPVPGEVPPAIPTPAQPHPVAAAAPASLAAAESEAPRVGKATALGRRNRAASDPVPEPGE